MGREDLNGCTYTRSVTNVFLNISQYSQENSLDCWILVLTKLETFRPATLLK